MFELDKIYNEDAVQTMCRMEYGSVDIILTSPPYNTSRPNTEFFNDSKKGRYSTRYVDFNDHKTPKQYASWTCCMFNMFEKILKENGVILYNINYGVNTHSTLWDLISEIQTSTDFCVADVIAWKKRSAVPNTASPNKLTRIWEPIFVFCRKDEYKTFTTNKQVVSNTKGTGQKNYENTYNFISAKNNDGPCKIHKATFSTDMCKKLLRIYGKEGFVVFDPFIGTGTTAIAAIEMGMRYVGCEIYQPYFDICNERIEKAKKEKEQIKL